MKFSETLKKISRKLMAISFEEYKKSRENPFKKNDHFSLFQKTPSTKIITKKELKNRPSPIDAEYRSYCKALDTLKGEYKKREPLTVWKVKKKNGNYYYSVRDGNTTYQMLVKHGWDSFPVHVEKEIDEKDLTPVAEHTRKT